MDTFWWNVSKVCPSPHRAGAPMVTSAELSSSMSFSISLLKSNAATVWERCVSELQGIISASSYEAIVDTENKNLLLRGFCEI